MNNEKVNIYTIKIFLANLAFSKHSLKYPKSVKSSIGILSKRIEYHKCPNIGILRNIRKLSGYNLLIFFVFLIIL